MSHDIYEYRIIQNKREEGHLKAIKTFKVIIDLVYIF